MLIIDDRVDGEEFHLTLESANQMLLSHKNSALRITIAYRMEAGESAPAKGRQWGWERATFLHAASTH